MRTTFIAALLCATSLVFLCACSQQSDSFRKQLTKAEQGDADAQTMTGYYYLNGFGVEKDEAKAVKWFQKAAGQNYAPAQSSLGYCYDWGQGVEADYMEAANWFRKAADQNYARAQLKPGYYYEAGLGVEKDSVEAYAWFSLAVGEYEKAAFIGEYENAVKSRDRLEKTMFKEQVAAAQKRSRDLRAMIDAKLKSSGK